jgi:hypothetical protein
VKLLSPPKAPPAALKLNSVISPDLPLDVADFTGKRAVLLWRGSRDGFSCEEFHKRCDGHGNTLTLIKDKTGNAFGGFTPLQWDSPYQPDQRSDDDMRSFLFTIKNPHRIRPKRFPIKAQMKQLAINCCAGCGPHFHDIGVQDNEGLSHTYAFGSVYTNDTGVDGKTFFTGEERFTMDEIEVFEIQD